MTVLTRNRPRGGRFHRARTTAIIAGLLGAAALTLTGCGIFPAGGQKEASASAMLQEIPGVDTVYLGTNSSYSGVIKQSFLNTHVTLEPGAVVTNLPALLEYVLAVTWSANQLEPNQSVSVGISSEGATVPGLLAAADSLGWTSARTLPMTNSDLFLSLDEVRAKLGSWPGKVPSTPSGLIEVAVAPTPAG